MDSAMSADSPLHNLVNIVRLVAVQQMTAGQQATLAQIADQITRLEAQVRKLNKGKYNVNFLGPASGFAIGDGAMTQVDSALRPLLEQVLAQITRLAAPLQTPPYTEEDKAAYLTAVIAECDTIKLPLATGRPAVFTCARFTWP